jgi:membrane protease YdiL (CAAX protease family)
VVAFLEPSGDDESASDQPRQTLLNASASGKIAGYLLLAILASIYLAFSVESVRVRVREAVRGGLGRVLVGPALLLALCLAFAAWNGLPVARMAAAYAPYLVVPTLLVALARTPNERFAWPELLAILLLWLPIELRYLPPLRLAPPVAIDASKLVALVLGLYLFLAVRPLDDIGYTYRVRPRELTPAVVAFGLYAIIALPMGLVLAFISWHPVLTAQRLVVAPIVIYLLTAVPEEFLFRGLIQNLLARRLPRVTALVMTSIVFGASHFPDARYILLATIAGVAYGWVYEWTRKITVSAITHTLVDAVWVILFRR